MPRFFLVGLPMVLCAALAACSGPPVAGSTFVKGTGKGTIDGALASGEWTGAGTHNFSAKLSNNASSTATFFVMNDADSLYVAVQYTNAGTEPDNFFSVTFDPLPTGNPEPRDQLTTSHLRLIPVTIFEDIFLATPTAQALRDSTAGGTSDGAGTFGAAGAKQTYEMSHPLDSSDDLHDFSLAIGDTVGICFTLSVGTTVTSNLCPGLFFIVAQPPVPCSTLSGAPRCTPPVRMERGKMFIYCVIRNCAVIDPLPQNCMRKFSCPGCPPGALCQPRYQLTLDGLGDAWEVDLVDSQGARFHHERRASGTATVLTFSPTKEAYRQGSIGDYSLVFRPRTDAAVGREWEIRTTLRMLESP